MKELSITERQSDSVIILDLKGNIKLGEGNTHIHQTVRQLVERGEKNVLLNLAEVTHIDSSGLGALIAGYITLKKNDGVLKLLNLTEKVRDLMVITKLLTVFNVYQTESEAIKSFQPFFKDTETGETASSTAAA